MIVSVLAIASPARADDLARARALYEEAGDRERAGDWRGAQERLRAALRIHETPHLHFALGWALERGDDVGAARSEYRAALDLAERVNATEVIALASARLAAVGPDVAAEPRGEEPPAKPEPPRATVDAAPARRNEPSTTLPWALVGGGAALAAGGAALLVSSSHDASERDAATGRWCAATACVGGSIATRPETPAAVTYRHEALDAASSGNTKQVVGAALAGVGVVSAAVGVFLLARPGSPRVAATIAPGIAAASATVSF